MPPVALKGGPLSPGPLPSTHTRARAGESLAECAAREVLEETGVRVRADPGAADEGFAAGLGHPTAFAAVDSVHRDSEGRIEYHYAVIEARGRGVRVP
jgi:8-oxo-dGTP pyrophosphatase MutT (NUDIX family)